MTYREDNRLASKTAAFGVRNSPRDDRFLNLANLEQDFRDESLAGEDFYLDDSDFADSGYSGASPGSMYLPADHFRRDAQASRSTKRENKKTSQRGDRIDDAHSWDDSRGSADQRAWLQQASPANDHSDSQDGLPKHRKASK